MRNLTIRREKATPAKWAAMKIYIEDPLAQEMTIQGVSCRKLGELKNGQMKTFPIDEKSWRIFVIADRLSKDYSCGVCQLPEGSEDVYLVGSNELNPASGNAFVFHHASAGTTVQPRRKKGWIIGIAVLVVAVLIGVAVGRVAGDAIGKAIGSWLQEESGQPKTFSDSGLEITLTDAFSVAEMDPYTVCYDSPDAAVFALQEPFTLLEGLENWTLEEYGALVRENNGLAGEQLQYAGDLPYFTYEFTNEETNETYSYATFLYKTHDAFWLVQFVVLKEQAETLGPQILEWAESVRFPL